MRLEAGGLQDPCRLGRGLQGFDPHLGSPAHENGPLQGALVAAADVEGRVRLGIAEFLGLGQRFVEVDPAEQPNRDQVFFGATVRYLRSDGQEEVITIVGVDEVDPAAGRISWIAPVARALIKAREGDIVALRTPAGDEELEILEVSYPG